MSDPPFSSGIAQPAKHASEQEITGSYPEEGEAQGAVFTLSNTRVRKTLQVATTRKVTLGWRFSRLHTYFVRSTIHVENVGLLVVYVDESSSIFWICGPNTTCPFTNDHCYSVFCLACCFLFDVQFPVPLMKEDSHFIIKYPHHHPKR